MTIQIDTSRTYSTIYTDYEKQNCLQKAASIPGVPGKCIKIEQLAAQMQVVTATVTGTLKVTAQQISGPETTLATWTADKTVYKEFTQATDFTAEPGNGVTLKWYLKTSNAAVRSRLKLPSFTYSIIDAPVIDPPADDQCIITIECNLEGDARDLIEELKKYLGNNRAGIFVKV